MMEDFKNKPQIRQLALIDEYDPNVLAKLEKNFTETQEKQLARKMKNKMKRRKKPKKKVRVLGDEDVEGNDDLLPSEKSSITEESKEESSSSSISFSSDGFSSIDSQASRVNFWMDINTNDNEYTNAVITNFSKPKLSR